MTLSLADATGFTFPVTGELAMLRRRPRKDWLNLSRPEHELLKPLPIGGFRIERAIARQTQTVLAL